MCDPPASTSSTLGLQMDTTLPSLWGAGDRTQASVHATQAFYQLSFIPSLENAGVCTYLEHFNSTHKWE